jgi:hypothetical protein
MEVCRFGLLRVALSEVAVKADEPVNDERRPSVFGELERVHPDRHGLGRIALSQPDSCQSDLVKDAAADVSSTSAMPGSQGVDFGPRGVMLPLARLIRMQGDLGVGIGGRAIDFGQVHVVEPVRERFGRGFLIDRDTGFSRTGSMPNVARIYDYYLGGRDSYAADREVARLVLNAAPDIPLAALENREFLKRAIEFLVCEAGIDQFIDVGPGLPTQGNIHELVQRHKPDAPVVYVDNDSVVLTHGRALLYGTGDVTIVDGDVRKPDAILSHSELRKLIDLRRPVAVCMSLVLHFISNDEDPWAIVARLRDSILPGSYLVLTHVTGDERTVDTMSEIRGPL